MQQHGITDSEQMIRRWLSDGRIKGQRSTYRKEGWKITKAELYRFIEEVKPAICHEREIQKLKKWVAQLEMENKELQEQLNNITSDNITTGNIKELTRAEVEEIWQQEVQKVNETAELLGMAHNSLIGGIFKGDADKTNLYNPKFKLRPYVCPFSNKKFGSPEALVKTAMLRLIKSIKTDQERKLEKEEWAMRASYIGNLIRGRNRFL